MTIDQVSADKLLPEDLNPVGEGYTTGLNTGGINPKAPMAEEVFQYLMGLNYEPTANKVDIWDCLERAVWGVAHALRKFPGCAIGVAEGYNAAGEKHAVIIIWEKGLGSFFYMDPTARSKLQPNEFGPVSRIEAFPPGVGMDNIGNQPAPIGADMTRIGEGDYVQWKTSYNVYPLPIKGTRTGPWDDLIALDYEKHCVDINAHVPESNNYGPRSRAFWSYIHIRRKYEGCAIGIAFGKPEKGNSPVVNVLWYNDGQDYKRKYYDPAPDVREEVSFEPTAIFF